MARTTIPSKQVRDETLTSDDIGVAAVRGSDSNLLTASQREIAHGTVSTLDLRDNSVSYEKLTTVVQSMLGGGSGVSYNFNALDASVTSTFELPDPSTATEIYVVKKIDTTETRINITTAAGTIDGESSVLIGQPGDALSFFPSSTLWRIF